MSDELPQNLPGDGMVQLVTDLTGHSVQDVRAREERERNRLREIELQYQFVISGEAAATPVFETFEVLFDYAFIYAPGQRESTLEYPHFTYGSQSNPPVGVHATVTEWLHHDNNGGIVGAVVAVGAVGSGNFTGTLHLTFQGYAALREGVLGE